MTGIPHITTGGMIRFTQDSTAITAGAIRAFMEDIMDSVGVSAGDGVDMVMVGVGMVMAGVEDMAMVADGPAGVMATAADITEAGMAIIMDFITSL